MKIAVFGLGYVGLTAAGCLTSEGHHVFGVDVNEQKVSETNAGRSPIKEPGLDTLLADAVAKKLLTCTTNPTEHLNQGCCSLGAELDEDEAGPIAAFAATIEPERFQFHDIAQNNTIFSDDTRSATRVVDGACIFLNRPGFAGGAGCALHLEALHCDESPLDWKPSVCWQLPIKVDWEPAEGDREIATVRGWTRSDWGAEGKTMDWCCTEGAKAYVGDQPVVESMAEQLTAIAGQRVYIELRRKLDH